VEQVATSWLPLHLSHERECFVATDLQRDQRVRAPVEDVLELAGGHAHLDGVGTESVDDGRHLPGTAQPSGGA
jgi:hypothetical protein